MPLPEVGKYKQLLEQLLEHSIGRFFKCVSVVQISNPRQFFL